MKEGKSLIELAKELTRQKKHMRDFVPHNDQIELLAQSGSEPELWIEGIKGAFPFTPYAHTQLGGYCGIPKPYYDRMMAEKPELLATNVNAWLHSTDETRMVRTLDNRVRAFLSPRYRRLNNFDMAEVALPELSQRKCQIVSSELTMTRFYLKAVYPVLEREISGHKVLDTKGMKVNDIVQAGAVISNSEVGAGAIKVEPMLYRLSCLNGMMTDISLRKYHIGREVFETDNTTELLTDEALAAEDKAFWLKFRDVLRGAFDKNIFNAIVDRAEAAAGVPIPKSANLEKVVELTTKRFALPDSVRPGILQNLIRGEDLTQWGLVNAVTATANDVEDYDAGTDYQRIGGKVLELSKSDFSNLMSAAA